MKFKPGLHGFINHEGQEEHEDSKNIRESIINASDARGAKDRDFELLTANEH